ncbi:MAG TPA: hypothetical protein VIG99_08855 [Myxococcaceae bacterium]
MSANEPGGQVQGETVGPEPMDPATGPVEVEPEPPEPDDWRKRETFRSAMAQIAVAAVILAGLVTWRYLRAVQRNEDAQQVHGLRVLAASDDPKDLQGAVTQLQPVVGRGIPEAIALSARLHVELWRTHGLPEHERPAREQLALAERADVPNEERYAARALVLLMDGKPGDAETLLRDVEHRGGQAPWLSYALGRALQARGDFRGAAGSYQRAMEAGWKDPGLLASCGEGYLELGRDEDAARAFTAALGRESGHVRSLAGLALAKLFAGEARTLAENAVKAAMEGRDALTPGLKGRALAAAAELARQRLEQEQGRTPKPGEGSDVKEIQRVAEEAVAARPGDPVVALVRAHVLVTARDPAGEHALAEAAKAHPFAPAVALAAGAGGADGLAVLDEYARRFAAQLPGDQAYWLTRGQALRSLGRSAEATAAYDTARALGGRGAAKAAAALASSQASRPR